MFFCHWSISKYKARARDALLTASIVGLAPLRRLLRCRRSCVGLEERCSVWKQEPPAPLQYMYILENKDFTLIPGLTQEHTIECTYRYLQLADEDSSRPDLKPKARLKSLSSLFKTYFARRESCVQPSTWSPCPRVLAQALLSRFRLLLKPSRRE